MPARIQRKRTRGWKMPPDTVYVGRPTKWGNPFIAGENAPTREAAVRMYREHVDGNVWTWPNKRNIREELRGKDLACWCRLDHECHADVLLEIANA